MKVGLILIQLWRCRGFNPHPAGRLDESYHRRDRQAPGKVSIHIQLLSWMKAGTSPRSVHQPVSFNPHPAAKLDERADCGANEPETDWFQSTSNNEVGWNGPKCIYRTKHRFQSTSSCKAGWKVRWSGLIQWSWCFNPHPTMKLDERGYIKIPTILDSVSIHIQQWSWMKGHIWDI